MHRYPLRWLPERKKFCRRCNDRLVLRSTSHLRRRSCFCYSFANEWPITTNDSLLARPASVRGPFQRLAFDWIRDLSDPPLALVIRNEPNKVLLMERLN